MKTTMKQVVDLIAGWNTSGTNSNHDPAWIVFKSMFRSALVSELKKINAVNIVFSYGHYYISGFFTVNAQPYYFSISDVRHFNNDKLLYRTAKDYKDYTGGCNHYAKMETDMFLHSPVIKINLAV